MTDSDNTNRRNVLKVLGAGAIGAAGLGSQTALADGQAQTDEIRRYLHSFDPSRPDEVEKAIGHLLLLDTREKAENILFSLSEARQNALRDAIKRGMGLEFDTGRELLTQAPASSPDGITTSDAARTYHCKGVLKNATFGTTEGVFDHYVHWAYGGSTVDNFSHWKRVKTPGWLTYWNGETTDYIDNREDYGVSKMGGNFEACVTKWGCYLSTEVDSGIWVYPTGGAACNPWNDSH